MSQNLPTPEEQQAIHQAGYEPCGGLYVDVQESHDLPRQYTLDQLRELLRMRGKLPQRKP